MFNPISLLASVAPTIAKAASGNLLGAVKEGLKAFGISDGDEKKLVECIKGATPEQLAKLKQIDNEYKLKLEKLEVDLEKIAAEDRDSARDMQKSIKSIIPGMIGTGIIGGFFIVLLLMFLNPDVENRALDIMLGSLGTMSMSVVSFYFGSSKSSSDKNILMGMKAKEK